MVCASTSQIPLSRRTCSHSCCRCSARQQHSAGRSFRDCLGGRELPHPRPSPFLGWPTLRDQSVWSYKGLVVSAHLETIQRGCVSSRALHVGDGGCVGQTAVQLLPVPSLASHLSFLHRLFPRAHLSKHAKFHLSIWVP